MKKNPRIIVSLFFLLLTGLSCTTVYQPQSVQYKSYRIGEGQARGAAELPSFLASYSEAVNRTMNDVVGEAERDMDKKQPESTLGNFLADALLVMAEEKFSTKVDAAFINYGGIRLNQLPAGPVTTGKIFEIMPFDNLLILQKMKGTVLQEFLDLTAAKGGWPLAGLSMQLKNNKAVNVKIGGKPLDPDAVYTIANSDFIANGGDNAEMCRKLPQITNGYLMRDAFLDYIKKRAAQGKNISASIENRVSHAQ